MQYFAQLQREMPAHLRARPAIAGVGIRMAPLMKDKVNMRPDAEALSGRMVYRLLRLHQV